MSKKYKLHRLILLLGIELAAVVVGISHANSKGEEFLTKGNQLLAEGRFADAVAEFNRFKQAHPRDPRPYFYLGVALLEMGRMNAAAAELNEAVRLEPNKPEYHLFHANVMARLGHKALALEALTLFKKAKIANQLTTVWLWLLSDVYYRLEQNDDALRVLEVLSKRNPNDPRNDLNRGQVYVAKGNHNLARKFFEKSIQKKPANNAIAYFELGKILHQKDEMIPAKKVLLEAVSQEPTNPEYLLKLGVVCLALSEVEEAIEFLERAEASGGTIPEIYYALGRAYQKKGEREKSESYLKRFQELSSTERSKKNQARESGNLLTLAENQLDQGNKTEARSLLQQLLEADPDNWDAHGYLAEMFLASGDLELANLHLVKMEEIDPDSVVGNYLMATYWYRSKDFARARSYAERAKAAQPGNSELRNLLGNIYLGLGLQEQALREYEAAIQFAPDRSDYRQNLQTLKKRSNP